MAAPTKETNRALAIVDHAVEHGYGVIATCCYNLEGILASVRAAEAKNSPVIIQLFPWSIEYAHGLLLHAAKEAADKARVPVAVHMDHAQSPEIIKRSADLGGFDGIMVDMSHYEKEENMAKTRELVAYLHARGIIAEAEPGRINGGEDGVEDTGDLESILTTPEQAEEFMALGIDWLAPAFGNVHGRYGPKGPTLQYDRLERVHAATRGRVHMVLHGGSGFGEHLFRECIKRGTTKININDAFNDVYTRLLKEKAGRVPLTTLIEEGTQAMQKVIELHMDYTNSTGQASGVVLPQR
ncbi:Ketose-bisphosphate aldolase, class-II [Niveomyces insectorum RCEF 264]|uniref:Fructose-bisphosphate aldolase n=1 Tax=Niveomyces insectorum RCEF 264 TaxID=1081102 RepID=A0A167YLB3_9HYPO|nr:Ketose-bisphosphate aldolase, class-II [Niveomyces insectorum RCEF 264]